MAKKNKKKSKEDDGSTSEKMKRKAYEKELRKLQVELCHLQEWVKRRSASLFRSKAVVPLARAARSRRSPNAFDARP